METYQDKKIKMFDLEETLKYIREIIPSYIPTDIINIINTYINHIIIPVNIRLAYTNIPVCAKFELYINDLLLEKFTWQDSEFKFNTCIFNFICFKTIDTTNLSHCGIRNLYISVSNFFDSNKHNLMMIDYLNLSTQKTNSILYDYFTIKNIY